MTTHIDPSAHGLCVDPSCRTHHDVPGSPPRVAVDGLNLCEVHTRRLAEDALICAVRHRQCELALTPSGGGTEPVSGSTADRNARVNQGAIDARAAIERTLSRTTATICVERGFATPPLRVPDLARFVAASADWLAARPDAGDTSAELRMVVDRARAVAFPQPLRRFPIRTETGAFIDCPQRLAWPDVEVYGPAESDGTVRCPGVLWFVQRATRADWMCNGCGHVVPPVEWVRHARLIRLEAA